MSSEDDSDFEEGNAAAGEDEETPKNGIGGIPFSKAM